MLLTLVPMYKITKLFVAFFVGFCLVSFIPANNATREMRLASVGAPGLNAFYEDVVHKATVLFAHPNSLPSLEIQSSRTPDESNDSHSTERPKALPNINADITSQNFGPRNSTLGVCDPFSNGSQLEWSQRAALGQDLLTLLVVFLHHSSDI